ncbi:sigma-54 dependent transcriptional regulator [Acetobacter sp. DsW_063]|uniref:sigma-54-dependent transcriptional regulator n=1 Tax=Acetobacter sp. DsW_063 TaxID=1514894 RepID=UPI000A37603E|nr:sigma-54 dependent transcriptional regulator [Acetobacter sp. DsW_063]
MRVLIVGYLGSRLGQAANIVISRGAQVDHVGTVSQAIDRACSDGNHHLVICEVECGIRSLVNGLASQRVHVPVLACGPASAELAAGAISDGAEDYLPLPPDTDLVASFLQDVAFESHKLISIDPGMSQLLCLVQKVAISDASVLVCGESGTGKEILSRYIHKKSKRSKGPFVAFNCAALPETLIESELFGHEKGAFSGAATRRIGRFEAANGGTLLLDEISEMDVRMQAKLLRAIQEREVDRLGGNASIPLDVRIIATSNRDLKNEIKQGRFREDLYFRLNVVSLTVPPLRSRRLDIVPLAQHFSKKYCELNGLSLRTISDKANEILTSRIWKGNVRELENAVHRAVLLSSGDVINVEDFNAAEISSSVKSEKSIINTNSWVGNSVDDVEQALILDTLTYTDGNRTHAASILGISIRALRNKLRNYAEKGANVPRPSLGLATQQ